VGLIGFPAFRPRVPWIGADLQTLRNFIVRPAIALSPWPAQPMDLPMRDGSGDRLTGFLHAPLKRAPALPLAILIHGLTGSADSTYVRATARHLLERGHRVLRLNLRGAGSSGPTCRFSYHAGRAQDVRDAIAALPADLVGEGVLAMAFSLGANLLLKLLGEDGRLPPARRTAIRAAAAVSAPIALAASSRRFTAGRNRLYHAHLLASMKREALRSNAALDANRRAAVMAARSIYDFDDRVVGPSNGFSGAEEYYARCSAAPVLPDIAVPTLIVHALNDPWIPAADYLSVAWAAHPNLTPLLPKAGGHVGFHGSGSMTPWHDLCAAQFFATLRS
jgi:predicted alpha/beta-fold hydrolase